VQNDELRWTTGQPHLLAIVQAWRSLCSVQPHCTNAKLNSCRQDLNNCPWRTGGDQQDALVLLGWRISSRTWNLL